MHIVIIDDHQLFSEGLKSVLEQEIDVDLVKIFDGKSLDTIHRYIHAHQPDIVLLDIQLGTIDGIKLGEHLMVQLPDINLLFLTGNDYPEYRRLAAGIGARGFLSKSMNPHELAGNLRKIINGEKLAISNLPTKNILNKAELQTLQLICAGTSNASIAQHFDVTERAIDYRIQQIKKKLEVSSITEAAIKGVKLGLVRMHS